MEVGPVEDAPLEARRILDAFGSSGVYLSVDVATRDEAEQLMDLVDTMRPS